MKNKQLGLALLVLQLSSGYAFADHHSGGERVAYTTQAAEIHDDSRPSYGFGYSKMDRLMGGTLGKAGDGAMSFLWNFDEKNTFQFLGTVTGTAPLNFGLALIYKRTVWGNTGTGFHLGGGVGYFNARTYSAGTDALSAPTSADASFEWDAALLVGFHFEPFGTHHINASIDGGPSYSFAKSFGKVTGVSNLAGSALSPAFGLSIHYIF